MRMSDPVLIGVIVTPSDNIMGRTCAWVAFSNKNCVPAGERGIGYIYGVMETLFNQHPLFKGSECNWREAEPNDMLVWKDSSWPTIYVY